MFMLKFEKVTGLCVLCLAFVLAACAAPVAPGSGGTDAYVNEVIIEVMESFPVQVSAVVKGDLADGCVVLDSISAKRQDEAFVLTVHTHRAGDICTEALVPFEQQVPLDVVGLKAGVYAVTAHGVSATFTLDSDNAVQEDGADAGDRQHD